MRLTGAIRYMAAFAGNGLLYAQGLEFELSPKNREVAAVPLFSGRRWSVITPIGFLYKAEDIVKAYAADVWSQVDSDGKLVPNRRFKSERDFNTRYLNHHDECFIRQGAVPIAIVIHDCSKRVREFIEGIGKFVNLPVIHHKEVMEYVK